VIAPDKSPGQISYQWVQMLPGRRFLYMAVGKPEDNAVYAASLTNPAEHVKLLSEQSKAVYAPAGEGKGFLLWKRGGTLVARELNLQTLRFAGEPQPIADGFPLPPFRQMHVSASANGLLLYGGTFALTQFGWFDRTGKLLRDVGEPVDGPVIFRLSPDERQIALARNTAGHFDLWLLDTERGLPSRLTTGTVFASYPIWSPDGRTILYSHIGETSLFRKAANGTGEEEVVTRRPNDIYPNDWSGDGRWVLAREIEPDTQDLWMLPVTPDGKMPESAAPKPYLRTRFNQTYARFSSEPSPRWVAYQSDESGQSEIYIDSFPEPRSKKRISTAGGRFPVWGSSGRELFYMSPDYNLMAVAMKLGADEIEASAPRELFRLPVSYIFATPYEASRDGQRFLVLTNPEGASESMTLIVNWPALLKKGAAAHE
jgi:hypothetical protein